MPANRGKTGRTSTGQFAKGTSGNPAGRPKRSEAEEAMLAEMYSLAPLAAERLRELMTNPSTPAPIVFRCIELIVDRVAGRVMTTAQLADFEDTPRIDFSSIFGG